MLRIKYYTSLLYAVICIGFGISISYVLLTQKNGGFPYKFDLKERNGYVDWVGEYKYGIRFSFVDDKLNFEYPSKSDGQGIVKDSLISSEGKIVNILYEWSDTNSPIYSDKEYHNVFEISVDGNIVRSYEESEEAWKSDNKLMPFIAALFLIGGVYIGWKAIKEKRK